MHDSILEEVGATLGDFLMVDSKSSNIIHSTYAHILVHIDDSKGLPTKSTLCNPIDSWIQCLDYEGFMFRCRAMCEARKIKP